jgi:hypothetical protein
LNLLCHVFQVRHESICNLGRITSRLRDVIAHLQEACKHRQRDFTNVFSELQSLQADALLINPNLLFNTRSEQLAALDG